MGEGRGQPREKEERHKIETTSFTLSIRSLLIWITLRMPMGSRFLEQMSRRFVCANKAAA